MNRIKEGFLLTRNPFNAHQIKRISLLPEEVTAIVFWTRNAENFIKTLPQLNHYNYYFQYTITGYSKLLEKHLPNTYKSIDTFCKLSDLIGSDKVIWRYDPILLSNVSPLDEHKRKFEKISNMLRGRTNKVVISFADLYKKAERNLNAIPELDYVDILNKKDQLLDLCTHMVNVSKANNMVVETCSEDIYFEGLDIKKGKCIDDNLLKTLFNIDVSSAKDPGQRMECGCIKSVDIGQYNTCMHGCEYCYATYSQNVVKKNQIKHDPESPFLLGGVEGVDRNLLSKSLVQQTLF